MPPPGRRRVTLGKGVGMGVRGREGYGGLLRKREEREMRRGGERKRTRRIAKENGVREGEGAERREGYGGLLWKRR